jgi:hypothetical protein
MLALLVAASPAQAGDRVSVDGYFKSFIVLFDERDVQGGADGELLWANNNRGRLNLAAQLSEWLEFNGSYELSLRIQDDRLFQVRPGVVVQALSIYRVDDLDLRIWPDDPGAGDHVALFQNLDRVYFTASATHFDLVVGRQAIAWGSAHAINPTDIIAPFLYTEIDTEDRIGVDAARLRIATGSLGELDLGYVAGEDFQWAESAAFLRGRFSTLKTDVALLFMAFRENALVGLDVARSVGDAGAWCEAGYVWAGVLNDTSSVGNGMDYGRVSIGADYNFNIGNGLYAFLEYHYNGAGTGDAHDYLTNVQTNPTAYLDGAVYLLGKQYLIPGVSYQLTPLTLLFGELLVNLSDGSFLVYPYIEYNISENVYLSVGGYAAVGDNPAVLNNQVVLNSEFGTYPSQLFAFLRYYF